jgi:hypothetical protein
MTRVINWDSVNFLRGLYVIPVRGRGRKTCHVVVVDREGIVNAPIPER